MDASVVRDNDLVKVFSMINGAEFVAKSVYEPLDLETPYKLNMFFRVGMVEFSTSYCFSEAWTAQSAFNNFSLKDATTIFNMTYESLKQPQ